MIRAHPDPECETIEAQALLFEELLSFVITFHYWFVEF